MQRPGEALHRGRQLRRRSRLSNRPVVLCRRAGDQRSGALRRGERVNGSGQWGWISMRYAFAARHHRQPHPARCAIHRSLSVHIMHNIRTCTMAMESYSTVLVMCGEIYAFYGKKRRSYEEEVGGGRTLCIMLARRAVNIPRMIFSGKRLNVFLHVQIRSLS